MHNIVIVGYGNVGKHVYEELEKLSPDIYDPYIAEYAILPKMHYDFAFVCVPTEMLENGECDTSIVEQVVKYLPADIFVIKSTIAIGTTDTLNKAGKCVIFSPEYYGTTQHSSNTPNFLVLGGEKSACEKVAQLYYRIKDGSYRIRFTDTRTAELAKYMENCFLAMKVSFCCEFADIAKSLGISYNELREIFILDERMGDSHTFVHFDQPYWNSHCLNKDIPALISQAGDRAVLISEMYNINNKRRRDFEN